MDRKKGLILNARLDPDLPLESTVSEDRVRGLRPLLVVGNAGTTNTGAVDSLHHPFSICRRESMWFHVDGAIGRALGSGSP
jgi:glutamate/tyrosine decarboxylase-like PLP-dependent enzyme